MAPKRTIAQTIDRLWRRSNRWPSERAFLRAADVSEKYLSQLRARLRQNPDATIQLDIAEKLCRTLGVRSLKEASEDSGVRQNPLPVTHRILAIDTLVQSGEDVADITEAANLIAPTDGSDPDVLWWVDSIRLAMARRRTARRPRPA